MTPVNNDTPGCTMRSEFMDFVKDSPGEIADLAQLILGLCGMAPVVGEGCDAADLGVSLVRGDYGGALLSALAMFPLAGGAAGAAKLANNSDKFRRITEVIEQLAKRKMPQLCDNLPLPKSRSLSAGPVEACGGSYVYMQAAGSYPPIQPSTRQDCCRSPRQLLSTP